MSNTEQPTTGTVTIDGDTITYDVAGTGHPLVLIHGGLVDRRSWDDQMPAFARHYRVLRYDLRGYADSATPTSPYAHFRDLRALLDVLGIEHAYVLGLSMGAGIAVEAALAYPDLIDALVLVSPGLEGYPWSKMITQRTGEIGAAFARGDHVQGLELMTRLWTDGPMRAPEQTDPAMRERVRAMTLGMLQRSRSAPPPEKLEPPALARLNEIHVATLVVVGDQDVPDSMAIADLLERSIPGARTAVVPGTAHHLNMEQPAEFNRIVLDFLSSLSG